MVQPGKTETIRRVLPALIAALLFAAMAALYAGGYRALYDRLLAGWGVAAFDFPFVDTDTVLSAVRCLRAGIDVYAVNPCDALGRVYDYSPLWLLLARFPVTRAWVTPAGIAVDLAFFASLTLLPAGRGRAETGRILIGVLAPAVAFAVERGNNDLVLFALAAIAAALMTRAPALRALGYGAALLGGLLKYYPMTLMAMAARERPRGFLAVAGASAAVVAVFLAAMGHDLARAVALVPIGSWFNGMFGSSTLPGGIAALLGWGPGVAAGLRAALSLGALAAGIALGLRPSAALALERLGEGERSFLLAGGLLMIGCFFTAQNIGYRATHLLLALPALTALAAGEHPRRWRTTTVAVLLLLWSPTWRAAVSEVTSVPFAYYLAWGLREALWWGVMTMLIAATTGLLARSPMGALLLRRAA